MGAYQEGVRRGMLVVVVASTDAVDPITRSLRRKEDRTLAVTSPHEVWHLLAHSTRPVTSVVVGMDQAPGRGLELVRDLQEDYPGLNVVLLSRYSVVAEDTEFPVLVEPFSHDDVRTVLTA
jgi:ActR/RegA family two-component response regulator